MMSWQSDTTFYCKYEFDSHRENGLFLLNTQFSDNHSASGERSSVTMVYLCGRHCESKKNISESYMADDFRTIDAIILVCMYIR